MLPLTASVPLFAAQADEQALVRPGEVVVQDIRIEGNETIPESVILQRIQSQPERPVSERMIREDKRSLMSTRWFFSVSERIDQVGDKLTLVFKVHERPIVQKVQFVIVRHPLKPSKVIAGRVKEKHLEAWTGLKAGSPYDHLANREAISRIEQEYKDKGYYFVKAELVKGSQPGEREVVIRVKEGPRVQVSKRTFGGNKFWSDGDLEKNLISKEKFLVFGGHYNPDTIPADVEAIKQYYRSVGFFDIEVSAEPLFSDDNSDVNLRYTVREGRRYAVREIRFEGNSVISESRLRTGSKLKPGEMFSSYPLSKDVTRMLEYYGDMGHYFASVNPVPQFTEQEGIVDLVFEINEDRPRYVRQINVSYGGDHPHTKQTVALDRVQVQPGDLANPKMIRRGRSRLAGSGLFEQGIAFDVTPVEPGQSSFASVSRTWRGQSPSHSPDDWTQRFTHMTLVSADEAIVGHYNWSSSFSETSVVEEINAVLNRSEEEMSDAAIDSSSADSSSAGASDSGFEPEQDPESQQTPQFQSTDRSSRAAWRDGFQPAVATSTVSDQMIAEDIEGESVAQATQRRSRPAAGQPSKTHLRKTHLMSAATTAASESVEIRTAGEGTAVPTARVEMLRGEMPRGGHSFGQPQLIVGSSDQNSRPEAGSVAGMALSVRQGAGTTQSEALEYQLVDPQAVFASETATFVASQHMVEADQPIIRAQSPNRPLDPATPRYTDPILEGSPYRNQFREIPPGWVDIDINATEGQTGRLMFGAGVNSNAGLVGSFVWDESNFDIYRPPTSFADIFEGRAWRGGGQRFRAEAAPGDQVSRYSLSWTDPYFLYSDYSLSVSGFYFNRFYPDWTEDRWGGRVGLGRQFTPEWSGNVSLRLEEVVMRNPAAPTPAIVQPLIGSSFLSTIRTSATHDTRDSSMMPSDGHYFDAGYEQAFGEFSFPKLETEFRQYFTLFNRPDGSGRQVLTLAGSVGWSSDDTPVFERYFGGGFQSFRGFAFRGVTPRSGNFATGGTFQALGTVEYRVPVTADDMINVVAFSDFGTVDDEVTLSRFRASAGFGLRVVIPAMGPVPLAFDFAFPLTKQDFDDQQIFSFYVGINK